MFNKRNQTVGESIHVMFDEIQEEKNIHEDAEDGDVRMNSELVIFRLKKEMKLMVKVRMKMLKEIQVR